MVGTGAWAAIAIDGPGGRWGLGRVTVSAFSENNRELPLALRYGKIARLRANDSRMGDKPYQGTHNPPPTGLGTGTIRAPYPLFSITLRTQPPGYR
jgi:hypothetical protein